MTLNIFIPSRGRPDRGRHHTIKQLESAGLQFTVVRTIGDESVYPAEWPQVWVEANAISDKRQKILEMHDAGGKYVMLDDDLIIKKVLDDGRTRQATTEEIAEMFQKMDTYLDEYPIVGVAQRFMINQMPQPFVENSGKMIAILGYNTSLFGEKPWPVANRLRACSDVDFTMQLSYRGLSRILMTEYCHHDQANHGTGGCSIWRTPDVEVLSNMKLAELWPDHVTLVSTDPPRVRISWKRIYEDGVANNFNKKRTA